MDTQTIHELIALFKDSRLSAMEIEENGLRIRLENHATGVMNSGVAAQAADTAAVRVPEAEVPTADTAPSSEGIAVNGAAFSDTIDAPMVGIFYTREKLGKAPLCPGDPIEPDTVVCAIEAMKMMCEIKAEKSGVYAATLFRDGDAVEFGARLIGLR